MHFCSSIDTILDGLFVIVGSWQNEQHAMYLNARLTYNKFCC